MGAHIAHMGGYGQKRRPYPPISRPYFTYFNAPISGKSAHILDMGAHIQNMGAHFFFFFFYTSVFEACSLHPMYPSGTKKSKKARIGLF